MQKSFQFLHSDISGGMISIQTKVRVFQMYLEFNDKGTEDDKIFEFVVYANNVNMIIIIECFCVHMIIF